MSTQVAEQEFRYPRLWLLTGWCLVGLVIYGSLTPNPVQLEVRYFDKFSHLFSYFVLMVWFGQLYTHLTSRVFFALLFVSMGIVLELLQPLGGMRLFEWGDMLANTLGVILALLMLRTTFSKSLLWFESRLVRLGRL